MVAVGRGGHTVKKRTKVLVSAAIAVPLVLGGGATAYASHYRDKALPGSSVVGLDVGGMTRAEVAAAVRERAAGVGIDVTTAGGTNRASLTDLGYDVDVDATVERVFEANDTWPSYAEALFSSRPVEVVATGDDQVLDRYVNGLSGATVQLPKDAMITLAADKRSFTVKPGVTGRSVDTTELQKVVAKSARTLTSAKVAVEASAREPAVTTAEAKALAGRANTLVKHTLRVGDGSQSFTATAREKTSWVTIPTTDGEPGTPVVDEKKVAAWVAESAKSVDTQPRTGIRYVSSAGKTLRVDIEARDGVEVTNTAAVTKDVVGTWASGRDATGQFTTKKLPATWTDRKVATGAENLAYPAGEGEKWIDVNLAQHTMTAYVGGKAVFGPVKMVNGAPATPSDVGTFKIFQKNAMMTMRGSNADGSDYETPNVPWSSFYNGGEALHGAYWRDSFGYAASHGCINLPISTAKWVYDWAPIGTPVVVHH